METLSKYCFAVFFCISLFGQYAAATLLDYNDNSATGGKTVVSESSGSLQLLLDLPFGTEPGDDEIVDDEFSAEYEREVWLGNTLPASAVAANVEKTSFSDFLSSVENREPVPLVILHHSWKSFLS